MLKNLCFSFLIFFVSINLCAAPTPIKSDSLFNILKINNRNLREGRLINYIKSVFEDNPIGSLSNAKVEIDKLLIKYNVENKAALDYFIESIYHLRVAHLTAAENAMLKAIDLAGKKPDHYLLYAFFTHLAFLQTYAGNTIEAVSSFRVAKKEAITLDDPYLQIIINVNISDICYRNHLYSLSLFYLNQAQSIIAVHSIKEQRLKNVIYYNKAENYFRMGMADSLKKYNKMLYDAKSGTFRLYIFRKRTDYYLDLLNRDYVNAIKHIIVLQKDSLYRFDNTDEQNLANAYYNAGKPDSAKYFINHLLAGLPQNNHPGVKFHLYGILGQIAEKKNNYVEAASNFKMALNQSEDYINKLTQVGNISSQIKIDEMQGFYIQKEVDFKRERLWLIFIVVVAVLIIAVVTMFYRNAKQKRYYEKLLFDTQRKELAFINSHEVRRHLSNILGIIETIKHSDDKEKEYFQAEDHLLCSARNLDEAIKSISQKLDN